MQNSTPKEKTLPPVPHKRFFSIGEAAKLCLVKPYVLRFWEKEFSSLKPQKRQGRRYYCPNDICLIRQIRTLLYIEGYTIQGAKTKLSTLNIGETKARPTVSGIKKQLQKKF